MSAIEEFKKTWEEIAAKLDGEMIDDDGVRALWASFNYQRTLIKVHIFNEKYENKFETSLEIEFVQSKLLRAMFVARAKYRLQNKGIWARIFRGSLDITKEIGNNLPK